MIGIPKLHALICACLFITVSGALPADSRVAVDIPLNPEFTEEEKARVISLLSQRFGYGSEVIGGAKGIMTEITDLSDDSLLRAITDDEPRWIYFCPSLDGKTWHVPNGSTQLGAFKTIDGRGVDITWQYGYANNDLAINLPPVREPVKRGQLAGVHGQLIMTEITHVGDLGWPYKYEKPWFKNGATDGLEIWRGSHYWIHKNTWKRMSDESLGVYHIDGCPNFITFSNNVFLETKTGSLIGSLKGKKSGHITIAYNLYHQMVNGRSPGEFRNMNAHVFNNVIGYVNDEGMRVGRNGRVVSEYNIFDLGSNPSVSGPRAIRYVSPQERPLGVLHSNGDIVSKEAARTKGTKDEGFITHPEEPPFAIPYRYNLIQSRGEIHSFVGAPK
ncbi:MAG: hypothetical protein AAF591_02275 [Verrucomicrobiota bacterium]